MDKQVYSEVSPPLFGETLRQVPHNIEAEQSLLGQIFLNNRLIDEISGDIEAGHFFEPIHGRLFQVAKLLIEANQEANPFTVKSDFEGCMIGDLTISQYIGRLVSNYTVSDIKSNADVVKDAYLRRQAIQISNILSDSAFSSNIDIPTTDLIENAQSALDKISDHGGRGEDTLKPLCDSSSSLINNLRDPSPNDAISTGLKDLDGVMCGGWQRGELHVVGARSSMGKSTFALSSALKSAKEGYEVLLFSLEMPHHAIAARCLSDLTYTKDNYISYSNILKKSVENWQIDRLEEVSESFKSYPLEIDDQRGLSIANIHSRFRKYINSLDKEGRKPDLLIVDHIGLIKSDSRRPRHEELGFISDHLATIAKDYGVAVVTLCQLNRSLEGRDNKRPELHDLRNSGEIEENAACVMGLYRPAYYLEKMVCDDPEEENNRKDMLEACKNEIEACVLKQRNGPCRSVDLWCNMPTNSIGNRGRV